MYDSLKDYLNVPFSYQPYISKSGTGVKQYGDAIYKKCYPVSEVKVVKNDKGEEVVSTTRLYLDMDIVIGSLDLVLFEGKKQSILSIGTFYEGDGSISLRVVYL
jgi:hypothetical protein